MKLPFASPICTVSRYWLDLKSPVTPQQGCSTWHRDWPLCLTPMFVYCRSSINTVMHMLIRYRMIWLKQCKAMMNIIALKTSSLLKPATPCKPASCVISHGIVSEWPRSGCVYLAVSFLLSHPTRWFCASEPNKTICTCHHLLYYMVHPAICFRITTHGSSYTWQAPAIHVTPLLSCDSGVMQGKTSKCTSQTRIFEDACSRGAMWGYAGTHWCWMPSRYAASDLISGQRRVTRQFKTMVLCSEMNIHDPILSLQKCSNPAHHPIQSSPPFCSCDLGKSCLWHKRTLSLGHLSADQELGARVSRFMWPRARQPTLLANSSHCSRSSPRSTSHHGQENCHWSGKYNLGWYQPGRHHVPSNPWRWVGLGHVINANTVDDLT